MKVIADVEGEGEAMGAQGVLEYVNSTITTELAGDPSAIKEPGLCASQFVFTTF